jgi:hypothetical protein
MKRWILIACAAGTASLLSAGCTAHDVLDAAWRYEMIRRQAHARTDWRSLADEFEAAGTCPYCEGTGVGPLGGPCPDCGGTGRTR